MKYYDIRNFGAQNGGLSTVAIQAAIDECEKDGGGTIVIKNGTYISGTIFMKSNVHLRVESGARLMMSGDINDFPDFPCEWNVKAAPRYSARCLIYIGNCENVSIGGLGIIDCNGAAFCEENPEPAFSETDPFRCKRMRRKLDYANTPGRMIFVMKSKNVTLCNFTMTEMAGGWGIWVNGCEYVNIRDLKLYCCPDYPNSDGIHINCSRDVFITDCAVHSGDDALVVRANTNTLEQDIPCENVIVKGWPKGSIAADLGKNTTRIERIAFNDIIIDRTHRYPIKIVISESDLVRCEYIRNIQFNNLNSRTNYCPYLTGRANNYLEDISFINCRFEIVDKADVGFTPRCVKNLKVESIWNID